MLKNFFNVTFRSILKHKFYSFINILGLSIGITCFLMITLYVKDELSYDKHLPAIERLYRLDFTGTIGGNTFITSLSSVPAAQALMNDYPEVESAVRMRDRGNEMIKPEGQMQIFNEEKILLADSNFFEFFQLPLIEGDPATALAAPKKAAISEAIAKKYFGNETAVGKTIEVQGWDNFEVTAVYKEMPSNQHFHADVLFSITSTSEAFNTQWMGFNFVTYLKIKPENAAVALEAKFPDMIAKYIGPEIQKFMGQNMEEFKEAGGQLGYALYPVKDIHLNSSKLGELEANGDITYVYLFSVIAFFILLIACINFMNLSTARSANRAKEVGVRKVLGAQRPLIVRQFLAEALILSFFSFMLAYGLCFLLLPSFNTLAEKQLAISALLTPGFIITILGLIIAVGLLAGSYPAFYLSGFKPVEVLKGKLNLGMKSGAIRSFLVVFQFTLSIIMIVGTMVIYDQLNFIRNKKLGYQKDHLVIINDPWLLKDNLNAFKTEALRNSAVVSGTLSSFLPVNGNTNNNLYFKGKNPQNESHIVSDWRVDQDYVPTFGIEIKEGRNFSREFPSDSSAIVVNEAFVKQFGLENPVGEFISTHGDDEDGTSIVSYKIIGVMGDFHYASLRESIYPLMMKLASSRGNITFKVAGDNIDQTIATLKSTWEQFGPGQPFSYNFIDQQFEEVHKSEMRIGSIFMVFASLAVFIACLGLFGLAAFTAEQRNKEIGVRKVLGASVSSIMSLLSREFVKLIGISFVIAAPTAYYAVGKWLDNFAYRTNLSLVTIFIAGLLSLVVAWLTMSFQTWRAARANPVNSLRSE
ncbi:MULTISPECIES: ABC transporter permease [unclassified Imperialibacter]|uniref:ABC transporter permease n=1 Tax=unclassified Imperialibacter TaxID=2629706 RepID=UPI0012516198|nr:MULTISPECIES: ABC transporter permease [unclassified Imperialibacter]CAD5256307.1 putative ABC transport system permease protein [Imperialibacter sp. 89]CAD5262425.1 putative ABC transport system permease protein [Imperialibacter sp. 75]VVT33216.1 putative ABC transport system permease protein [Imperialibacter sp. EC-SDR9]